MNILHIVYAKVWGGGEQYVYNFCEEEGYLGNKGIVVVDGKYSELLERFSQVAEVVTIPLRGIRKFLALGKLIDVIDKYQVNVVNCHSGTMAPLCIAIKIFRPRVKIVVFRHNVTPNKGDAYHRFLQRKVDAFICVSHLVYDLQIETACKDCIPKFFLVISGISTSKLVIKQSLKINDRLCLGYAGRITENKGILVLLETTKLLVQSYDLDVVLILCGEFDEEFRPIFERWVQENKFEDRVTYMGLLKNMNEFYQRIDVFVLPSIVKESFGLVLCEAMYCKIPVISTDSGAQKEIIDDGMTGFIVPVGNVEKLAGRINQIREDISLREKMVAAASVKIKENYSFSQVVANINGIYERL